MSVYAEAGRIWDQNSLGWNNSSLPTSALLFDLELPFNLSAASIAFFIKSFWIKYYSLHRATGKILWDGAYKIFSELSGMQSVL